MSNIITFTTRRQQLPLPKGFDLAAEVLGLSKPKINDQLYFTLRRRKNGAEIGLILGRLWWNLSYQVNFYPSSFALARKWVVAYAARYGYFVIEETWSRWASAQRGYAFLDG